MTTVKLIAIGNSIGMILPREVLAKLHVDKGDMLYITDAPDGITLRAYDETFARHMEAAEKVMREDRDVLRRLAE